MLFFYITLSNICIHFTLCEISDFLSAYLLKAYLHHSTNVWHVWGLCSLSTTSCGDAVEVCYFSESCKLKAHVKLK